MSVRKSATMEAGTYCVAFPDWGPLGFKYWPSENGFVMQTHFGGHDREGKLWGFYAYGFVETNEAGEITRWETHVSPEYNDFLDRGYRHSRPFQGGTGAIYGGSREKAAGGRCRSAEGLSTAYLVAWGMVS